MRHLTIAVLLAALALPPDTAAANPTGGNAGSSVSSSPAPARSSLDAPLGPLRSNLDAPLGPLRLRLDAPIGPPVSGRRAAVLPRRSPLPTSSTTSTAPIPVPASDVPPAGRRLSANGVLAIADALPKMRAVRSRHRGSYGGAYLKMPLHWQVSYFSHDGKKEIGQVIIDDLSGRVLEQWTGFQVAWSMARGYPGAFGRHVNALYVWLALCLLFAIPFLNFRRPLSLANLDLLVLLSLSVSLAFFNHAHIYASVPLAYPPLLYLLARMLALVRRAPSAAAERPPPLRLLVPASWLAIGVVFLLGFRVGLNVTDSNVIDVGYAGVIGAQRIVSDRPLYGAYPADNEHGDTYGPASYEAYVPFQQVFGWSGAWDDLPAAHAAAIVFDLLAVGLLFLLGRRMRGPTLGVALAYAWVTYPFTLFALESNSNDTLVAVLVLGALLAASCRSKLATPARGALGALAGLSKFAPLVLAPLLATHDLLGRSSEVAGVRRLRSLALFLGAFLVTGALALLPALSHDSLHTIYERTIAYQANRGSPFSVWGLYGGLGGVQLAVQIAAVALALLLAVIPRRADLVGLAAACAAVIIAVQLGIEHWFYLYIPWFFPLVMLALLGRFSDPGVPSAAAEASAAARSRWPAAAVSS
jgi:hypothetical protein